MKKITILYVMNSCKNLGPTRQTLNIIKNLDMSLFEVYLLTLRKEEEGSLLSEYSKYVRHFLIETTRSDIVFGYPKALWQKVQDVKPDIIHTIGVFPDFLFCKKRFYKHVLTLRSNIYEDYVWKYGVVFGNVLILMQQYAIRNADKVVCCSKSLRDFYQEKKNYSFDFIRNGVEIDSFIAHEYSGRNETRKELGVDNNTLLFIYTGQLIRRKNLNALIDAFAKFNRIVVNSKLLIVGDGNLLCDLEKKYSNESILFLGKVSDVRKYLWASDVFVSASLSEGLPNSVIEAMAAGLPVVLSDIPQHKEMDLGNNVLLFDVNDKDDLAKKLMLIADKLEKEDISKESIRVAKSFFSAKRMSDEYCRLYMKLVSEKGET